jgi:hypothetical protein
MHVNNIYCEFKLINFKLKGACNMSFDERVAVSGCGGSFGSPFVIFFIILIIIILLPLFNSGGCGGFGGVAHE